MPFLANGVQKAAQAFANEVNAEGGLLGRRIEVVAQDDAAKLERAEENAAVALRDPDHWVSVGHPFSSFAYPIGKIYNKAHKLLMSPYATSERVSEIGGTVFQLCFNDRFQARTLASVAVHELKARRIFILRNESDLYAEGLARLFEESLEKSEAARHGVVWAQYRYIYDKLDFPQLFAKIRAFGPDLVFVPELKIRAAEIVRQLGANGLGHLSLLGADGWGSEDGTLDIFFSGAKTSDAGGYFYTYHWHPDVKTPENVAVKAALKKWGPVEPYGPGVLAYEALQQLRRAVVATKHTDGETLAAYLRGRHYRGVTGPVHFLPDGTTERPLVLLRLTPRGLVLHALVRPK